MSAVEQVAREGLGTRMANAFGTPRLVLGVRGAMLSLVVVGIGLGILHNASATGIALLTGLLLLLADLRGERFRRARAYLVTTVAGALVVAAAVVAGGWPDFGLAVFVGLVGAGLTLVRSGGGVLSAAGTTLTADLLLGAGGGLVGGNALVLATATLCGGLVATLLAMVVRPAPWVSPVQLKVLDLLTRSAEVLRDTRPAGDLAGSSRELLDVFVDRPERPASPLPSGTASVDLLADMSFLLDLLGHESGEGPTNWWREWPGRTKAVEVLEAARAGLVSQLSVEARSRLANAIEALAAVPTGTDFQTDSLRFVVLAVGQNALGLMWRAGPGTDEHPFRGVLAELRVRLAPGSPLLLYCLSAGALFAGMVLLARHVHFAHPQWVLMVAVSTFYPYSRAATSKAVTMIAGTLLGVVAVVGIGTVFGGSELLWTSVLLCAAFVALAAPRTHVGGVVGQAAFTLLSLSLVVLVTGGPSGNVARERATDIAIGAAIAAVTVLVVAPRGLRARLRRTGAALLKAAADVTSVAVATGPDEESERGSMPGRPITPREHRIIALTELGRAEFLRCVDIGDVIRGSRPEREPPLTDWLDAMRLASQSFMTSMVCAQAAPAPAPPPSAWSRAGRAYRRQARALHASAGDPGPTCDAEMRSSGAAGGDVGTPGAEPWISAGEWLLRNCDEQQRLLASLEPNEHR